MARIWSIILSYSVVIILFIEHFDGLIIPQNFTGRDPRQPISCSETLLRRSFSVHDLVPGTAVGGSMGQLPGNISPTELEEELESITLMYIEVDFSHEKLISGIITRGSRQSQSRVKYFRLFYSTDCVHYTPLKNKERKIGIYAGNTFANTTATVMFDHVFQARCVRYSPVSTITVHDDTDLGSFDLLGCDAISCMKRQPVTETSGQDFWTRYRFDKEKVITAITITLPSLDTAVDTPVFILAHSRTCNFEFNAEIISNNGTTKVYGVEPGRDSVRISDDSFPIRAQCVAVFSQNQDTGHSTDGHSHVNQGQNQFTVEFEGCDALPPHEPLDGCGKTYVNRHETGRGGRRRRKRVVGGAPSVPGEWPWLVSLYFLESHTYTDQSGLNHLCGASLIHPQWLLTAAHCLDERVGAGLSVAANWRAVLGEHYQRGLDGTEQIIEIERIVKHTEFVVAEDHELLFDIALMKLREPAKLSDYVNTVCLDPGYRVPDHTSCVIAGWGNTNASVSGEELPHHATLQILPNSVCGAQYDLLGESHEARSMVSIQDSVLCAVAQQNGIDSCQGDSGGPLVCYHDNHWTQVGVVSFGLMCGDLRYPGVYTRVNHYYDWIQQVINGIPD